MTPRDERDLERQLERIRFEPRASLGPEILGRRERGEEPRRFPPAPSAKGRGAAGCAAAGLASSALANAGSPTTVNISNGDRILRIFVPSLDV